MVETFNRKKPFRGRVRAVILDWAGTAIDFGCFGSIQPFIDTFNQNWVETSSEQIREYAGLSCWDHLLALLQTEPVSAKWLEVYGSPPSEHDLERLHRSIERMVSSDLIHYSDLVPGLPEVVFELRKRGIKIGSTSSHGSHEMEPLIEAVREKGFAPDAIVCSSDVPAGRPYPWMCYQNAISLEVYPLEALVKIGGTVSGIQEGLNAGMWTIAVMQTSSILGLSQDEIDRMDQAEFRLKLDRAGKKFSDVGAHFVVSGIMDCLEIIDRINQKLKLGERP
jgi:phosphonoacetaldehyde hydrolase